MKYGDLVFDNRTQKEGTVFAAVLGLLMTYAVSVGGKTMFYCANHGLMFEPKGACPECAQNQDASALP